MQDAPLIGRLNTEVEQRHFHGCVLTQKLLNLVIFRFKHQIDHTGDRISHTNLDEEHKSIFRKVVDQSSNDGCQHKAINEDQVKAGRG
jgi:hemerythrin superfamily protein